MLMRSGHTEAAVDLCKLATLPPGRGHLRTRQRRRHGHGRAADRGLRRPEHSLKRISVADLIAYRQAREKLVERVATFPVKTPIGELQGYAYRTPFDHGHAFRLRARADRRWSRHAGAAASWRYHRRHFRRRVDPQGAAAVQEGGTRGARLSARRVGGRAGQFRRGGADGSDGARARQWREIGLGAQILRDLGVILDPAPDRPTRAPMSASPASASRSPPSSRSRAEGSGRQKRAGG